MKVMVAGAAMFVGVSACSSERSAQSTDSTGMAQQASVAQEAAGSPDDQMKAVLDQLSSLGGKPIETLTPAEARKQPTPADAVNRVLAAQGKDTTPTILVSGVTTVQRTVPGAAGRIPVTVYTPAGAGPFPVVVYFHGGGWVIGSPKVYDGGARGLAKAANAIVISVDYRMGPEHRFPAAHDDAYTAYVWAVKNAAGMKGNAAKVALAGESAGGGLAVSTAIRARDEKAQMPVHVLSVYPIAGTDTTTPSYVRHAMAKPLNRAMMTWFFTHYLRSAADRTDPRVNLVAANLRGLPPITIVNAEIDPLLSEGETLAGLLREAGVTVEQKTWNGVTHEFFGMAAVHDKAKAAQQWGGDALRKAFGM